MSEVVSVVTQLSKNNTHKELKDFHKFAVNSITHLSSSFNGIINAFGNEIEKSDTILEQLETSKINFNKLKNTVTEQTKNLNNLQKQLTLELQNFDKKLNEQNKNIDNKLQECQKNVDVICNKMKTELEASIENMKQSIGKSLGNVQKLQDGFERLEHEITDQLRNISERVDENAEKIENQSGEFKDQLNELSNILHNKAIELESKMEECVKTVDNKLIDFNKKLQEYQFKINEELTKKADNDDLKHKVDILDYEKFKVKLNENVNHNTTIISDINKKINDSCDNTNKIELKMKELTNNNNIFKNDIIDKLNNLAKQIKEPFDVNNLKDELNNMLLTEIDNVKNELLKQISSMGGAPAGPAIGTKSGNCIACGRGPSNFQPLSPQVSPKKKPQTGGGFNRVRRNSSIDHGRNSQHNNEMNKSPKVRRAKSIAKHLKHGSNASSKVKIDTESVRVSLPSVDNTK